MSNIGEGLESYSVWYKRRWQWIRLDGVIEDSFIPGTNTRQFVFKNKHILHMPTSYEYKFDELREKYVQARAVTNRGQAIKPCNQNSGREY